MVTSESSPEAIFFAALEKSSADERVAYLATACGSDTDLRSRVERMLEAHFRVGVLDAPPITTEPTHSTRAATSSPRPAPSSAATSCSNPSARAATGTVFMAEQTTPVQRKVALKIIKPGMDTRQVIARFEAERQALALMDHPNIAKVFDAGVTETGRPYFVMELVKGMPITKYCDAHHVEPRARLELFMQVCHAVQHAHQKGIIHRDLKPSNVLVAQYDGKPGAQGDRLRRRQGDRAAVDDLTMFTGFGDVIGTLEYMSPEQAEVNQLDVDTRSDIYSLGVLLYELLTGTTPLEHKRVMKAGLLEMLRVVREEEPPRPSIRLSTSEQLPSISASRGVEPKKLSGLVRGELDWIVMKALEKDRARRYETANGFATDVQRYLSNEAVQACPPSTRYRLRKFGRRNRRLFITAAAVAASLVFGTVISTWQAVRATTAERLAEARFAREAQARGQAQANLAKAREAVQQITQIADEKLSSVPHLEGVRRELLESALQFYVGFLRQESSDRDIRRETAVAYGRAAQIHQYLGNKAKALELLREAIARLEQLAAEPQATPAVRSDLINYYNALPFYQGLVPGDEVVPRLRRGIELAEQLSKQFPDQPSHKHELARTYGNLGRVLVPSRREEAEKYVRRSLALSEELGDEVAIAAACLDIGYLMTNTGNPEAEQWIRRALAIWEKQGIQSSGHRFHRR
jgi:serine/threonine protein kinase